MDELSNMWKKEQLSFNLSFFVLGVLCHSSPLCPHGEHSAPYCWPWPLALLWSDGWPGCVSDSCQGQALGVQLPQEVQVEHHVHAGWVAQPGTGPLCLHLQWVQAPCGNTLALHCLRGGFLLYICYNALCICCWWRQKQEKPSRTASVGCPIWPTDPASFVSLVLS